MSDWLSARNNKRGKDELAKQALKEAQENVRSEHLRHLKRNHEKNSRRYDEIFQSIKDYAKKASEMGFQIGYREEAEGWMSIVGFFSSTDWDGGSYSTGATLELRATGDGLSLHYKGRGANPTPTLVSINAVTDIVIGEWIRWAAGHGPDDPAEDLRTSIRHAQITRTVLLVLLALLILGGLIGLIGLILILTR